MSNAIREAPATFWVHVAVFAILLIDAMRNRNRPWFLPAMVVYGTVLFWYTTDFLLSPAKDMRYFTPEVISVAFLQISLFLISFRVFIGVLLPRMIPRSLRANGGINLKELAQIPRRISPAFLRNSLVILIIGWSGILLMGIIYTGNEWPALIWPPLRVDKISMYPLTRVGSGASFVFNAIGYIHILICALFGVIAVLAKGPVRWVALFFTMLSWPYFWFDRTRSKMLNLLLPGLITFLLFGTRSVAVRVAVVAVAALGVSFWFGKVMEFRAEGSISSFVDQDENGEEAEEGREEKKSETRVGQDMFKELCWINIYLESGRYVPNWGLRYFAEIVNPIPRTIWPTKPMPGIDYSIVRGFASRQGEAGVRATISTGMIGQGLVNFGPYPGAIAAAFLFALWAIFLARLWCQRSATQRAFLFLIGLGLTLNTGRDLTLLVLFPFVFGYVAVRIYESIYPNRKPIIRPRIQEKAPGAG